MKIAVIGGHLTPALAVCDQLLQQQQPSQIVFIGRIYSQDGTKQLAHEQTEVAARSIPFVRYWAPRLHLHTDPISILSLPFQFLFAFFRALGVLISQKPNVVVSFGGYMAVPICIAAWCLRIPSITHEQTRTAGMSNKLISSFVSKIGVSFEETGHSFPKGKVVFTGNPIRASLLTNQTHKPAWIPSTNRKPILYITGGNQGSQVINDCIRQALPALSKQWLVVHQCGNSTLTTNYKTELERAKKKLPLPQRESYFVFEWLAELELAWVMQNASVSISRAGANSVWELVALHLPSILVPLPFSHGDEQTKNAEWFATIGGGVVLSQKEMNPQKVVTLLAQLKKNRTLHQQQLEQYPLATNGAEKMSELIQSLAGNQ